MRSHSLEARSPRRPARLRPELRREPPEPQGHIGEAAREAAGQSGLRSFLCEDGDER